MKLLAVLALVASVSGGQVLVYSPYLGSPFLPLAHHVIAPVSTQYRAQDVLGQFTFATSGDNQARIETKTLDGVVRGAYSYVDPTGKLVNVHYQADDKGYRVLGANNLPEGPTENAVQAPMDTPEVIAARAQFQKQYEEVAKAAGASAPAMSRKKRQVLVSALLPAKATFKYQQLEPVEAAVPADTRKVELKEKEASVPLAVAAPAVVAAPHVLAPAIPHLYTVASTHVVPVATKATVNLPVLKPVDAPVAADTKKLEVQEEKREVISPLPLVLPYSRQVILY